MEDSNILKVVEKLGPQGLEAFTKWVDFKAKEFYINAGMLMFIFVVITSLSVLAYVDQSNASAKEKTYHSIIDDNIKLTEQLHHLKLQLEYKNQK